MKYFIRCCSKIRKRRRFFETPEEIDHYLNSDRVFIKKDTFAFHGVGKSILSGLAEFEADFLPCKSGRNYVFQGKFEMLNKTKPARYTNVTLAKKTEYIKDPHLMGQYKYHLRSYLLVASLNPLILFYRNGVIRRCTKPYNVSSFDPVVHISNHLDQDENQQSWSVTELAKYGIDKDYWENYFFPRAKQICLFMFNAHRKVHHVTPRSGRFHVIGVDFTIDSSLRSHLLEGNDLTAIINYPIPEYPDLWNSMMDLILSIQVDGVLQLTKDKYDYKGWRLVHQEGLTKDEKYEHRTFNVCQIFPTNSNFIH